MGRILTKVLGLLNSGLHKKDKPNRAKYLKDLDTQARNAEFRKYGGPDGLPAPPPELVYLVTGQWSIEAFYHNGLLGADCIRRILEKNGLTVDAFESILDFGCGAGRIMRHWRTLRGPKLHGTDYNPHMVKWCQKSLTFARFTLSDSSSRTQYEDEQFDFIYVISVFTHLAEARQRFWIEELTRILKPGGYLLITVHGSTHLMYLTPEQRQEFEAGRLIVVNEEYSGTNHCATYHPEQYVRNSLCQGLTVVDVVPGGAKDANQDAFLLQKPMKANGEIC